jgi:hypothetical protein
MPRESVSDCLMQWIHKLADKIEKGVQEDDQELLTVSSVPRVGVSLECRKKRNPKKKKEDKPSACTRPP